MSKRKSEEAFEALRRIPDMDKARAILTVAARNGKSQKDLVGLVVGITGIKTKDQALEAAKVWSSLLDLKPDRFTELAADFF